MTASGAGSRDRRFRAAITAVLDCGSTTPTRVRPTARTMSPSRAADPTAVPLTLRQVLMEQGVAVLGLIVQPKLIHPDQPPIAPLPAEPDASADDGAAASDRAEQSAIHLAFRTRMAAARICLPKGVLGAALRALHRERRACLQALQDRIAARHALRAHERGARDARRTAALTARGLPQRPVLESPEDTDARVRASILNKLGE